MKLASPKYTRVCLKVSGEALAGTAGYGIDNSVLAAVVGEIVADLIVSGKSKLAWQAFGPDRFSEAT